MLLSLLLDLGLLQVTCYLPDGEATPWAIVEDECIWCIFWPFLRQSKLMSPSFLRLKTRWPRLRHRQHQQTSHWWPEENHHYLGDTGGTPIAVIIRVELVRGDTIWFYCLKVGEFFQLTRHCKKYVPHVWLHFLWLHFLWFGWFKTLESDKSSRLLVRRMVEWLSGKTRPCNPQNSEPSPILPEMSGNKPSPTAGWLIIGFTMIYPGCFWVFSLTWACFRWLVICPMEKPPPGQ